MVKEYNYKLRIRLYITVTHQILSLVKQISYRLRTTKRGNSKNEIPSFINTLYKITNYLITVTWLLHNKYMYLLML